MKRIARIGVIRRWWPLAVMIAAGWLADNVLFRARYTDAVGHAAGHLEAAATLFPGLVLMSIVLWATPRARRQPDVWLAGTAWIAALVGVMIGNVRVVEAIGTRNWGDGEVARFGASLPGFSSGHDLAGLSSHLGVVAILALASVLLVRGQVSRRAAAGAVALSIVIPAWLIPGAGIYVLAVAACTGRRRRLNALPSQSLPVEDRSAGSPNRTKRLNVASESSHFGRGENQFHSPARQVD